MPRKTKIGTEVAHVTRDSDTTFRVKGQGHQAALLTAVLARHAAAVVGVGTCWPWETAATLPSARRLMALRRPRGEERVGAYHGGRLPTACCRRNVTAGTSAMLCWVQLYVIVIVTYRLLK